MRKMVSFIVLYLDAYLSKTPLVINIIFKLVQEKLQLSHNNGPSSKLEGFSVANSSR